MVLLNLALLAAGALLCGVAAWVIAGRAVALVVGTMSCVAVGTAVAEIDRKGGPAAPAGALAAAVAAGVVLRLFAGPVPVVAIVVADLGVAVHLRRRRRRIRNVPREGGEHTYDGCT